MAIVFPREVFPHAWLWPGTGGSRGHHHVCLEPWTGYPIPSSTSEGGRWARTLEPGGSLAAEVDFVLFEGLQQVAAVERSGNGFRVR